MAKKLLALDYHRNGICGTGFYVALFLDDDRSRKVCTWFGSPDGTNYADDCACAVLDVEEVSAGNIAVERNAGHRGDHYIDDMRRWVRAYWLHPDEGRRAWNVRQIAKAKGAQP